MRYSSLVVNWFKTKKVRVLSGQRYLLPLISRNRRRLAEKGWREHKESIISASGWACDVCVCRWPLRSPVWLTSEARARAPSGTEDVTCTCVKRRVSERTEQLGTRIWMRKKPESVQWAQRISKSRCSRCGGRTSGHAAQRWVVGHGEMGRKRIRQVPRVAHHVAVKGGVGWVRPSHRQPLPLVLHAPVLEPDLKLKSNPRLWLDEFFCMYALYSGSQRLCSLIESGCWRMLWKNNDLIGKWYYYRPNHLQFKQIINHRKFIIKANEWSSVQ